MSTITISTSSYYEYDITLYDAKTGTPEKFIYDKDRIFSPNFPLIYSLDLDNQKDMDELNHIFYATFIDWIYPKIIIDYPEVFKKNLEYLHQFYFTQEIDYQHYPNTPSSSQILLQTIFKILSPKDIENHPHAYCRYNFHIGNSGYNQDGSRKHISLLSGDIYLCK